MSSMPDKITLTLHLDESGDIKDVTHDLKPLIPAGEYVDRVAGTYAAEAAMFMVSRDNKLTKHIVYGSKGTGVVTIEPRAQFDLSTGRRLEDGETQQPEEVEEPRKPLGPPSQREYESAVIAHEFASSGVHNFSHILRIAENPWRPASEAPKRLPVRVRHPLYEKGREELGYFDTDGDLRICRGDWAKFDYFVSSHYISSQYNWRYLPPSFVEELWGDKEPEETGETAETEEAQEEGWLPMSEAPLDGISIEVRHPKWPEGFARKCHTRKRGYDAEGSIWFLEPGGFNDHPFDEYQWRPLGAESAGSETGK